MVEDSNRIKEVTLTDQNQTSVLLISPLQSNVVSLNVPLPSADSCLGVSILHHATLTPCCK